jgi:hypothetical protein
MMREIPHFAAADAAQHKRFAARFAAGGFVQRRAQQNPGGAAS